MKAVVYHADAKFAWGGEVGGLYEKLFQRFRAKCNKHGMALVHLTLEGQPGWGDENYHYSGLSREKVVLNREECFSRFLETAGDDVYWFAEPDFDILQMWEPPKADCTMLYRAGDAVAMNPAWRMATPKALPFFYKLRDTLRAVEVRPGVGHDWHGDSEAFTKVWKDMGRPDGGVVEYLGVSVEFRPYKHYIKGEPIYTQNYFGKKKMDLLK